MNMEREHPEPKLNIRLYLDIEELKFKYGDELIDPLRRRIEKHNEDCMDCMQIVKEVVKFY